MSRTLRLFAAAAGLALAGQVQADGAAAAEASCAGCHALEAPDYAALGVGERVARKAPPLFFAGNKYREGWLADWLQDPRPLRPAGYFPAAMAVTSTPEGDKADAAALYQHEPLDADTAQAVADHLMGLRPYDALVAAAGYSEGNVALRMGTMDFRKFKGCNACHQDAPGEGGQSGPVLYDAWERLTPEYMMSFIKDPTAWDPNTIMPRLEMNDAAANKLVDYLRIIGGEQ